MLSFHELRIKNKKEKTIICFDLQVPYNFRLSNEELYNLINKNVDLLKDFNEVYVYYMHSFNDDLISKQCNESEEKINYIKGYYNELVCFFNRYKSNGINAFLTRLISIEDEKLY